MGLTVVRANDMALKMAVMSDMGGAGHDGYKGCPDGLDKSGTKAAHCTTACQAALIAPRNEAAPAILSPAAAIDPRNVIVLHGRALRPDPHPPRITDIG